MRGRASQFVLLNGRVLPVARARIGVFDRGLLYGDGLFDTLRAYRGWAFALEQHIARLQMSARFLGIVVPKRPWRRDIGALLERNRLVGNDAWVRITVTRGEAPAALLPPTRARPTVIVSAGRLDPALPKAQRHGVRVTLLPFARHGFLAEHKVLNFLPSVLGKSIAARHDAFEGLFVDADGHVTEGTTTNVFIWHRGQLLTPAAVGVLPGLTRRMILDLAVAEGIRVVERPLKARELFAADEVFLTSSLAEVVPIVWADARTIGDGRVGSRTRQLQHLYRQLVDHAARRP